MSALPTTANDYPSHGHPDKNTTSSEITNKSSTASHPPPSKPDPTTFSEDNAAQRRLSSTDPSTTAKLSSLQIKLKSAVRQYPDFPTPGILFEDIMPIFADPTLHASLIDALEIHIVSALGTDRKPDVIVGPEARGFLFGPALALRLNAAFIPVRKRGKLPGPTETVAYEKEYGQDLFQIQSDSIKQGQKVVVVDDLIATGGSAAAAGQLVRKAGGTVVEYIFIIELDFLNGRDKLDAPVFTLLSSQAK